MCWDCSPDPNPAVLLPVQPLSSAQSLRTPPLTNIS